MNESEFPRIDRRQAIRWMTTAAAGLMLARAHGFARDTSASPSPVVPGGKGYGTDPDLVKTYNPGDLWPLTFTPAQRRAAIALCDMIIPADSRSPSASSVGVHDFIDEWVSAPYPEQQHDRPEILEGLSWIDAESQRRFAADFSNAAPEQQRAICDDICFEPVAKPEFKKAAKFFNRFRDLTAGGFYTTPEGMKDLRYVGNVPLATFDGPPQDLIEKLGLA